MAATTSEQMAPWEAARVRNAAHSPIHRLPNEILLQIMQHLWDDDNNVARQLDLYFFRQTCILFAQLFDSPWWQQRDRPGLTTSRGKALPAFPMPLLTESKLCYRQRLHQSMVRCATCAAYRADKTQFAARITNLQHRLDCSVCHWQHPAIAFTPGERTRRITSWRTCIANSGRVVVCPHKSFKMRHLRSFLYPAPSDGEEIPPLSERPGRTPQGWPVVECKKCFADFTAAGPREIQRPTVFAQDSTVGNFTVRWAVPVARFPKSADEAEKLPAETILAALPHLEAGYKALIGPQSSFLSERVERAIRGASAKVLSAKYKVRIPLDNSDERTLVLKAGEDGWIYLDCTIKVTLWGHTATGEVCDYTPFIPFLSPESIDLEADAETKHVTWCPDAACGTGKGWDAHLLTVRSWDECARDQKELKSQWERNAGEYPWLDTLLRLKRRREGREKVAEKPFVPFAGTGEDNAGVVRWGWWKSWARGIMDN